MDRNPIEELLRQQNKAVPKKANSGANMAAVGVVLIIIGFGMLFASAFAGTLFLVLGFFLLSTGISTQKAQLQKEKATQARPTPAATPAARSRTPESFSQKEERCDNQEPHRHYDAPIYDAVARQRESMLHLYEAGLLTKEEYADYVRRLK